jgi:DNA-binding NtrC family response regulator
METLETRDPSAPKLTTARAPGIVVVHSVDADVWVPIALEARRLVIGRSQDGFAALADERISREHAIVEHRDGRWLVRDLKSRNGTWLDGVSVHGDATANGPAVLRVGKTVALLLADIGLPLTSPRSPNGVGRVFRDMLAAAERIAARGASLYVHGESGAGKELVASAFREAGPNAAGPFVTVNCATIPAGLAERLLFGAKRGAYSGASHDVVGHVQAANDGVLFLDEVGELDLEVQAKLLRVLETSEVTPLGATQPQRVRVKHCYATHRDLASEVSAGRFRGDLYYRIATSRVVIPPLRDRRLDIAALVTHAIRSTSTDLRAHPQLVEACLLRPWPGNVRELLAEVRRAVHAAADEGADAVLARHLDARAGRPLAVPAPSSTVEHASPSGDTVGATRASIEAALAAHDGNASAAARALGINRTTFYRRVRELGVDLASREERNRR